jgi:hypothetical protein
MSSWLEVLNAGVRPELVWGVVPRLIAALYLIAFLSISGQLLGLVGSRGVAPVREQLAALRQHYPGLRRFLRVPSLLWISPSDGMLRALPWCGVACAVYALVGAPHSWFALLACFVLYLALDVVSLMFPWDCMLFEAGFLALFLPEVRLLPALETSALPSPAATFALRFLLVRVMWGFAKLKFIGTKRGDNLFLQGFMAWMPMCTPLGARLQHAPNWFLRLSYAYMWFVEVVCPGLLFFRGELRVLGALGLMSLMAGIWATGNWGFFNVGYAALCFLLFDAQASLFDLTWATVSASPFALAAHVVLLVHTLCTLLYFPNNSWGSHCVWFLSFDEFTYTRRWLRAIFSFFRVLSPLRFVHAYGVFPANSSPPLKLIPVFEGSHDGVSYRPYAYRYMPTAASSRTPIVAPHHPRLDHLSVYAGSGMTESDYLSSLTGAGKPYGFSPFSHFSWMHRTMQRLLEGEPSVRALFGSDPFPDTPPKYCRVRLSAMMPASLEHTAKTGEPWYERDAGVLVTAREKSDLVFRHWLSPPELQHPDMIYYRRASPALKRMLAALAAGTPHTEAVRSESDLRADEVDMFWQDFVPELARTRGDLSAADACAGALRERFGFENMLRLERIAERYVHMLRTRLEPHIYAGAQPAIEKRWCFNFHVLVQDLLLDGRAAFEDYLREPARAAARAASCTPETSLHFITVVRNEVVRFHVETLRIVTRTTTVMEDDIPGLIEHRELLMQRLKSGALWVPEVTRTESGVWQVHNFRPDVRESPPELEGAMAPEAERAG